MGIIKEYQEKSKEELIQQLEELNQRNQLLKTALEELNSESLPSKKLLQERLNELDASYQLNTLIGKHNVTLEELCFEGVNIMAKCLQNPDVISIRIIVKEKEFRTENFKITQLKQSKSVYAKNTYIGKIEVFYKEQKQEGTEVTSTKEEPQFLIEFAEIFGRMIEQVKTEETIKKREKQYREMFENMINGIIVVQVIVDDKGNPYDHCFINGNKAFEKLTGLIVKEELGKTSKTMRIKWAPDVLQRLYEVAMIGIPIEFEDYNESTRRYYHTQAFSPSQGTFVTVFNDITNHKIAEEKIKQAEEKFTASFMSNPAAMSINDMDNDNRYIDVNNFFCQNTGYTREEIIGHNNTELNLYADPKTKEKILGELKAHGNVRNLEYDYRKKNGEINTGFLNIDLIQLQGKLTAITSIIDITDKKNAETKAEESQMLRDAIVDSTSDLIWSVDAETKGLLTFNKAYKEYFKKILGIDLKKGMKPDVLLIKPEHARQWFDYYDKTLREGTFTTQYKSQTELLTLNLTFNPLKRGNKVFGISVFAKDITEQIKSEEMLKDSEDRFKKMFMLGSDGFYLATLKEGTLIDVNKEFENIFGYTSQEIIGKTSLELKLYNDPEDRKKMYEEFKTSDFIKNNELTGRRKDGKLITISLSLSKILIKNKYHVLGIIRDVTEQRKMEKALLESEERFRAISNNSLAGIYMIDDRKLQYVNPALARIFGYEPEELIGEDPMKFIHPDDYNLAIDKRNLKFSGKEEMTQYEFKGVKKNGEINYNLVLTGVTEINGRKIIIGNLLDITERKQAEEELKKAKEKSEYDEVRFKAISEQAMDGITLTDMEGNYVLVNKAFCNLVGYSENELLKMSVYDLRSADDETESFQFIKKQKEAVIVRKRLTCKNKSIIYADINGKVIEINNEKLILGIIRDVTQKMKADNDLIRSKEKAEESDRLKTAFLMNMSHEIRTPMNGILGFMELLKEKDINDKKKDSYIEIVNKSGERLLATINDIIEISQIEAGETKIINEAVNIEEIMKSQYVNFKPETESKNLRLKIGKQITGTPAIIKTDKNKLESILTHLIKNAIKFTLKGEIEIGNYIDKEMLVLYVKDTGIGIPNDKTKSIFESFIKSDLDVTLQSDGLGIGLSIVKSYTEALGGKIIVESELYSGSNFMVLIPYIQCKKAEKKTKITERLLEKTGNDINILIAEDDDISFSYYEKILSSKFNLIRSRNGEETVRAAKENKEIALILMDIKMQGEIDGLEATKLIRKNNKHVIIIAQTAVATINDEAMPLEAGCNDYITKPIRKKELMEVISKHCKRIND